MRKKKVTGLRTIRELWICDNIAAQYIREELDFPSILQLACLRKQTYDGNVLKLEEYHYGASSYSKDELSPQNFLKTTRKHWEIENGLHHVKDRSWREDHQYSKDRAKGSVLGTLRSLSLNAMRILLPSDPDRKKRKQQKSLPLQAISYIVDPLKALAKLAGI